MATRKGGWLPIAGAIVALLLLGLAGFFAWALQSAIRGGGWIGF